jgi:DNA-damage-inducible protein J
MTNSKSSVNVRINSEIKERAAQIFSLMGLDHTTAIDMFYRRVIAEKGLPFQPKVDSLTIDEQLVAALESMNIPHKTVEVNEHGHLIIDKDKDPDLYDWAVNG